MSNQRPTALAALPSAFITFACITVLATCAASPADEQKLASANTGFAFSLLKEITREQPARNVFLSPYSVSSVLQMICNGAGGKTLEELQHGGNEPARSEPSEPVSGPAQSGREHQRGFELGQRHLVSPRRFDQPAVSLVQSAVLSGEVDGLDFNDPASAGIMNAWVSEMTRGRIPGIVAGPISPETYLYLANAVYFKGGWSVPFEAKDTKERAFHLRGGEQKHMPMMTRTDDFSYRRGTGYQAVRLPYRDWDLAMYVFLPDKDSSPEKLLAIMNGGNWQRITLPGFSERKGTLVLPRFKLEYGIDQEAAPRIGAAACVRGG
jgi:serpin B